MIMSCPYCGISIWKTSFIKVSQENVLGISEWKCENCGKIFTDIIR